MRAEYDAIIVGSGPNGLAAAITLAQRGLSTLVVEAARTPGGGMRSAALTDEGFVHDVCSAVHPLGIGSPFFRTLPLAEHGLAWVPSPTPLAHVLSDDRVVTLERSVAHTAAMLGSDGPAYTRLFAPFVERWEELSRMVLGPLRWPSSPWLFARFGLVAMRSMLGLSRSRFATEPPGALLASIAAHAMVPLDRAFTASFALVLGAAGHAVGWPIARGGSRSIADALVRLHASLGGELTLGHEVKDLRELPRARAYLLDVSPRSLVSIARASLPPHYVERALRFRHGPGSFKIDWSLRGPIPWRHEACRRAVTVHLSGTQRDIFLTESTVHHGHIADQPFVLLGQPSVVDDTRAPPGKQTAWAYCHVPHGSSVDCTSRIESLLERHAPGFLDQVISRATMTATALEAFDANCVGGDISGGLPDARQLFFRPMAKLDPYATPAKNIFLCSASTPPGGGVHGMCGHWAARSALDRVFGLLP
ncbi:MAG: NAD(P)/FAD-dependent oxidoreductase [Deltaproteobacteria bacterium]|nr:NAD(P)/FAD-dependent oxidoreductase [Deltaproteobacteria bacterium]